uniref:SET domain-containing protein n=1 Tax=Leersia perrieri TaxID=77586 RepID=A0A0D9VI72_9ORYZ
MPDLSTVCLPLSPELPADAAGVSPAEQAGDAAAVAAAAVLAAVSVSVVAAEQPEPPSGGDGDGVLGGHGDGAPVLPVECRWSGRVRSFGLADAGAVEAAVPALPAPRRGGGKKPSSSSSAPAPSSAAAPHAPAQASGRPLEEYVREWQAKKAALGVPPNRCELPFLTGAPKAVECRLCSKIIYPGEEIKCSVSRCEEMFHLSCAAEDTANFVAESFKCPQHNADVTNSIEEAFCRLPLPYVSEDFKIDSTIRDFTAAVCKPPHFTFIRRSILKKSVLVLARSLVAQTAGQILLAKMIANADMCTNKPFRKDKKIKAVKTKRCGWGAISLERLEKGDFIIEYVGEVINDATCEQRLWDMKSRGDKNFYMCEISKDFTIDATFKGNTQVDGETRVGVFASRSIDIGEHLTYDYRFVHFGEKVKCYCGAQNCQGYLGNQIKNPTQSALAVAVLENQLLGSLPTQEDTSASRHKPTTHLLPWTNCIEVPFNLRSKRKINRICWGCKRKRSAVAATSPTSISAPVTEAAASLP